MKIKLIMMILLTGFISLAAIYKEEDPMGDTQTSPIAYKDKMEEIKQGEKEAPKPSFQLIPKEKFMIDSNLASDKPAEVVDPNPFLLGNDLPEDVTGDSASDTQHPEDTLDTQPAIESSSDDAESLPEAMTESENEPSMDTEELESPDPDTAAAADDWWDAPESTIEKS